MRRLSAALVFFALLAAGALPAYGRGYTLPEAEVEVRVQPNGAVEVVERITYSFEGSFSGAYREIPLAAGESLSGVSVAEGSQVYVDGGCTDLGCESPPGTFGVRDLGGRVRIVWHYSAADEQRTFEIRYVLEGLAKVYDDYVDVYLQVWGPEWPVELQRLTASMAIPSGATEEIGRASCRERV